MQDQDVNGKARSRASGGLAHPKTINDQAKEIKSIHESQRVKLLMVKGSCMTLRSQSRIVKMHHAKVMTEDQNPCQGVHGKRVLYPLI